MKVYLAGPITGISYDAAMTWREHAEQRLSAEGLEVISPMRGKAFLRGETSLKDAYKDVNVATKHAIFSRDKFDSMRSEILLLNLRNAKRVTIGSVMELAWAHLKGNFCAVVMEDSNPHVHSFVLEASSMIFDRLDAAIDYIIETFGKGNQSHE